MFNRFRQEQYESYNRARNFFVENPECLVRLESFVATKIHDCILGQIRSIARDYDEASYLYPFWQNYPPDKRGRQPVGDQYPWIEVGEHALGCRLPRLLDSVFDIRDSGLPAGTDQRFIVEHPEIKNITNQTTGSCWLFVDIKSVGPRDDQDHAVVSHNQVSGSGEWLDASDGVKNEIITATGKRKSHPFHCSVPPIYVLSDGTIAPVVILVIKPVYRMLKLEDLNSDRGQPLGRVTIATIPNGLLLQEGPKYLDRYPTLFFPGKDDKSKNPLKVRCRVSFSILRALGSWRVMEILLNELDR